MRNKIVLFLLRKKLGLHKNERFTFANQKQPGIYWFTDSALVKLENGKEVLSNVALNWLLGRKCTVIKTAELYSALLFTADKLKQAYYCMDSMSRILNLYKDALTLSGYKEIFSAPEGQKFSESVVELSKELPKIKENFLLM